MKPWSPERICVPHEHQVFGNRLVSAAMLCGESELSRLDECRIRRDLEDLSRMQARSWGHGSTEVNYFRDMFRFALGHQLYEREAQLMLQDLVIHAGDSIKQIVMPKVRHCFPELDERNFGLDLDSLLTSHECAHDGQLDGTTNVRDMLSFALGARRYEHLANSIIEQVQ